MCKRRPFRPQLLLFATCGLTATLTAACGDKADQMSENPGSKRDQMSANAENRSVGTSGSFSSNEKKPIDLTGCLQKAGGSYVITKINKPSPNAAPASKKADGSVVEREQAHAAQHAYRLRVEKDDDLEKLVGKQVKVSGTVTETSDLTARDDRRANDLSVGTSGSQDTNHDGKQDRARIRTGDLARVDVDSIQQVAEGCGR
jgi:hypothetical protein